MDNDTLQALRKKELHKVQDNFGKLFDTLDVLRAHANASNDPVLSSLVANLLDDAKELQGAIVAKLGYNGMAIEKLEKDAKSE